MKISTITLVLFLMFNLTATAQIPNAGFENWTGAAPDNWSSQTGFAFCAPDSNAHSGFLALKFQTIQGATQVETTTLFARTNSGTVGRYPMDTAAAPGYIQFYAVTNLVSGDVLTINVYLENNHNMVGVVTGTCVSTVSSTYQLYSFPINYSSSLLPDSASTWFSIRNGSCVPNINPLHLGTYALIDDISYDFSTGIELEAGENSMIIYPNPASQSFNVNYEVKERCEIKFELFTVDGRKIKSQSFYQAAGKYVLPFNVSEISSGIYFFLVSTDSGRSVQKIQILD